MAIFGGIFGVAALTTEVTGGAPYPAGAGAILDGSGDVEWPSDTEIGDIGILLIETNKDDTPGVSGTGWAQMTDSPVNNSSIGVEGTMLSVYWLRATTSSPQEPSVSGTDHCVSQIVTIRNCKTSGNPFTDTASATNNPSAQLITAAGVTVAVDRSMVLYAVSTAPDTPANQFTSVADNPDVTLITKLTEARTATGNGGGFFLLAGIAEEAGSIGTTDITQSGVVRCSALTMVLEPDEDAAGDSLTPFIQIISPQPEDGVREDSVITLEVTDNNTLSVVAVIAVITHPDDPDVLLFEELVHDGVEFRHNYQGGSNSRTGISGGYRLTVLRDGGWPGDVKFEYIVRDAFGNEGVVL